MKAFACDNRPQRGGFLVKLLLLLGLLVAVGAILWVVLLPSLVVWRVRAKTGFAVKVDKLSVNPFTGNMAIKGLVVKNPDSWPVEDFIDLREFRADVNLFSLMSRRAEINELVIDVAQVTVIKNQAGTTNAIAFRDGLATKAPPLPSDSKKGGEKRDFLIKHLVLKFDKLTFADYSSGRPRVKDYNLNINRDMRDVDSLTKITNEFTGSVMTGALEGFFRIIRICSSRSRTRSKTPAAKPGQKSKTCWTRLISGSLNVLSPVSYERSNPNGSPSQQPTRSSAR